MKLTAVQVAAYAGAFIAILIAVLDTWVFDKGFGTGVDLLLLGIGLTTLTGQAVSLVSNVVAANRASGS